MNYQHTFLDGTPCRLPTGKVVCVGLNYAAHVREMDSQPTGEPLLFIKPATAVTALAAPLDIPSGLGAVHFETELAVLIGKALSHAPETAIVPAIAGFGVALDLTLRDLQKQLRAAGHPWDKAKGWDGACPLSPFIRPGEIGDLQDVTLQLRQNGILKQDGNTAQMLTPIVPLIAYMSRFFTLLPGDVVLTGTPEGVGPLTPGDSLQISLGHTLDLTIASVRGRIQH